MQAVQVSLEEAVAICLQYARPSATASIELEQAQGRISAVSCFAPQDIPGFDRSRVDGYALHRLDVSKTSTHRPLNLSVAGSLKAGDQHQVTLYPLQTWRIMTGTVLPEECAAVVKQEDVEVSPAGITIYKEVLPGENIEFRGSVMAAGTPLLSPGQRISAWDAERLASAGFTHVEVFQRPAVYLMQTGDELVMPGNPLPRGKIYCSNRSLFFALIRSQGAQPVAGTGPTGDSIDQLVEEISRGVQQTRLVIITGGTQHGDYDLVASALQRIKGSRQLFAGIDIHPAHGTSAWLVNQSLVFNLPGNPGAGYVLYHALIRPVLNHLSGLESTCEKWISLPLEQTHLKPQKKRTLTRGVLIIAPDGKCQLVAPGMPADQPGWEVVVDLPAGDKTGIRFLPVGDVI